jgi:hypothetical protein
MRPRNSNFYFSLVSFGPQNILSSSNYNAPNKTRARVEGVQINPNTEKHRYTILLLSDTARAHTVTQTGNVSG